MECNSSSSCRTRRVDRNLRTQSYDCVDCLSHGEKYIYGVKNGWLVLCAFGTFSWTESLRGTPWGRRHIKKRVIYPGRVKLSADVLGVHLAFWRPHTCTSVGILIWDSLMLMLYHGLGFVARCCTYLFLFHSRLGHTYTFINGLAHWG